MSDSFVTKWTVACQVPLSMGFPRQEYWSGLPFPPPGDLADPGIKTASPVLQMGSLPLSCHRNQVLCLHITVYWHQWQETHGLLFTQFLLCFNCYKGLQDDDLKSVFQLSFYPPGKQRTRLFSPIWRHLPFFYFIQVKLSQSIQP